MDSGTASFSGFDEIDLRGALFAVSHYIRTVPSAPPSLWRLADKLDTTIRAMSARGHENGYDAAQLMEWIGTNTAAAILNWTPRHVRRRAADIDGRRISGRLVFDAAAVRDFAALRQKGEGPNDRATDRD